MLKWLDEDRFERIFQERGLMRLEMRTETTHQPGGWWVVSLKNAEEDRGGAKRVGSLQQMQNIETRKPTGFAG